MVLHREYFKYFNSRICIFCNYILRIISNTFSPLLKLLNALLKFVSYGPLSFFDKLTYSNKCEYDFETKLKRRCIYNVRSATLFQRWNNVHRRHKFSSTLIQRCFNVECLLGLLLFVWIFIPIDKFWIKILNILMQFGVGLGALRQFPWGFRLLSLFSSMSFYFKYVLVKAFSRSIHLQEHFIKPTFLDFLH